MILTVSSAISPTNSVSLTTVVVVSVLSILSILSVVLVVVSVDDCAYGSRCYGSEPAGDIMDIAVRAVGELIVTAEIEAISIAVSTYL